MNVIVVDDKRLIVKDILTKLGSLAMINKAEGFTDPFEALEYVAKNLIDIAFLDVEMPQMNGLELAKRIKAICKSTYIIFLTGFREYAIDAFEIHALGYLLKPVTTEKIIAELEHVKNLVPLPCRNEAIRVQCFGNFEVFVYNEPLKFNRSKTKELFAYLIDRRGASLTMAEISAVLWEETENTLKIHSLLRHLISDLITTLNKYGAKDIIIKKRNQISINVDKVNCDYYSFLRGDVGKTNAFCGEYMTQYSWAEFTSGVLNFNN